MSEEMASNEAEQIESAHPLKTGRHDLYEEALRLVGERYYKRDLIALVNWLLFRLSEASGQGAAGGSREEGDSEP